MRLMDQIIIESDAFEHREVKPHFINPCCFGEDIAAWLKKELLRHKDLGFELSEIIQEDYGWGFWASRAKDRFWITFRLSVMDLKKPLPGGSSPLLTIQVLT